MSCISERCTLCSRIEAENILKNTNGVQVGIIKMMICFQLL